MLSGIGTLLESTLVLRRKRTMSTLDTSATLNDDPAKHHRRNNSSRPLRRRLSRSLLRPPIPAVTSKIAPTEWK